jgi:hypothetical protein
MSETDDVVVSVRRQWNDYREAEYHLPKVHGLHWSNVIGGVNAVAPRAFLHGYVWCDGMISGELSHSCLHGSGPHYIKVCLVKNANKAIWPKVLAAVRVESDRRHPANERGGNE